MRALFRSLIVLVLLVMQNYLSAQEKVELKFGKISPADFDLSGRSFDTSAGAVYIADLGSTEFDGGNKGWFTLVYTRHLRIKVLNKNGFDAASFSIHLYKDGSDEEKLEKLKAATYNLEGDKVITTKLEDQSIFKDKLDDNHTVRKFTLPAVKEGSIIEVTYSVKSDFTQNLRSWNFQGAYPRLWSEYVVRIPEFIDYVFLTQGYHPLFIKSNDQTFKTYSIIANSDARGQDFITVRANVNGTRWVMKDVPPLKEEKYITSLDNYISKVEFQLKAYREPLAPKNFMTNWGTASENLLQNQYFGESLDKNNNWLDDEMKLIVAGAKTPLEKAQKIFAYVRDNFASTEYSRWLDNSLKNVFKSRKGNVAEINLLMTAMLKHEGLNAQPVLLSTRDNGYTYEAYPLLRQFNYVVAGLVIDDAQYYLDATEKKTGFSHLPLRCYNGHARLINATAPYAVYFIADSLKEAKVTAVFMVNGEKGKVMSSFKSTLGYYESVSMREKVAEKGKDDLLKEIKSSYPAETEITELELDSLDKLDLPMQVRYNMDLSNFNEDIVYFNPMMAEAYKDNPLKAAERSYPVEMPYSRDEVYIMNMEVPAGYVVDEIPKSARVSLNDTDGMFEYLVNQSGDRIMLRSRIKINRAYFLPADYETLRNFFDYVVKKHAEMIVFKKKK